MIFTTQTFQGIFSDICVAKQKPGRIEFDTRDVLSDLQDAKNSLQSPKNRRTTASRNEGKAIDSPLVASFSKNLEMAVQGCQTPRDAAAGSAGGVNRRSSARLANTFPDISTLPQTGVINVNTELPMEKSFARTESSSVERRIFGMSTQMVDDLFDSAIHEPAATETAKRPFPISPSEAKSAFKIPPPLVASGEEYSLGLVYNDPEEASAKRKLIESAQSSSKKQKPDAVIKYFMISGVSGSARSSLSQAIKKLGGVLLEGDGWDSLCTHLICAKPTKTGFPYRLTGKRNVWRRVPVDRGCFHHPISRIPKKRIASCVKVFTSGVPHSTYLLWPSGRSEIVLRLGLGGG